MTHRLVIANTYGVRLYFCLPVIASAVRCAAIRFSFFKRIKSSCARAARAPYFCTDRNRGKNRRTPFQLGFRTFPNDQRDKLPFGNLYCTKIRYVPINSISGKSLRYPVIARSFSPVAIRSLLKSITDSFTLRVQNDKPFSYFNHREIRGDPFPPPRNNNLKNYSFFISQFLIAYSKSTFINSFLERFVSDEI